MNAIISSTLRIVLHSGKLCVYHGVTNIDYDDDPFSMVQIYCGKQLLDAIPLGGIKSWRFERTRGPDRRHEEADKRPPPQVDRRQPGVDRRRQPASP